MPRSEAPRGMAHGVSNLSTPPKLGRSPSEMAGSWMPLRPERRYRMESYRLVSARYMMNFPQRLKARSNNAYDRTAEALRHPKPGHPKPGARLATILPVSGYKSVVFFVSDRSAIPTQS